MKLAHAHHDQLMAATFQASAHLSEESEGSTNMLRSAAILSALMLAVALLIGGAAQCTLRAHAMPAGASASDR